MMYHFQHIELLPALAVIPLLIFLFFLVTRWKRSTIKKIGDATLVNQLIQGYSSAKFLAKFILSAIAITAVILGIMNLQKPGTMENIERKGVDVVIALDVSKSMLAEDSKPNRLEVAKQLVNKLMAQLQNDRIGLILFAGRAYLQMPLTTDHGAARMYVQNAGPEVVPTQGTVIGEALRLSNSAFNSKEKKYKAVVLITDGEDHDPESIKIAQQLAANAIMINTVGIGSVEGAPIIDPLTNGLKKDPEGNTVISKLNEAGLQQLAQTTKGVYVRLTDPEQAVTVIMQQLGTIEKTDLEDSAFKDYKSYFQWFLAAAFLFLVVEFFLPERKWKVA
jgi:Ca-activated chloride channel family protein